MIKITKNVDIYFLHKPSFGAHTVHGLSFRLKTPLVKELLYKKN